MTNAKKPTLRELLKRPYSIEICHVDEPAGEGYFIAFMPEFGARACSATADTRSGAMQNLLHKVRPVVFKHALEKGYAFPEPISFVSAPPRGPSTPAKPVEPPRAPWPTRMLTEEIATRIRSAMEDKDMSIFDLSVKLNWAPARLLQWLDGSLADLDMEDENGSLRDLVQIGEALDMRWKWRIGKVTNVRGASPEGAP